MLIAMWMADAIRAGKDSGMDLGTDARSFPAAVVVNYKANAGIGPKMLWDSRLTTSQGFTNPKRQRGRASQRQRCRKKFLAGRPLRQSPSLTLRVSKTGQPEVTNRLFLNYGDDS